MRVAALLSLCVSLLVPAAAEAETGRVRRVGPWNIAATTEKGVFQYCMMARPETKTSPGFGIARGMSQLTLAMFSQKWKLEKGTSYPVTLVAGSAREELQAKVESATAVAVDLTGRDAFVEGLARVPALEVRAAASTLRLPLDQGAAALARLRDYLASEAPAPSNPFASAAERPGGGQAANPFKAPAQPEAAAPAAKPPAPAAAPRMRGLCQGAGRLRAGRRSGSPGRRLHDGIESGRETQAVQGIAASNRGFGYYKKGDIARSIASYTEAIRLYPEYPNPHWGRADVHMDRQAWDEAIAHYTAALKLDPKDDYSLQNRGRADLGKGAWDAALADFDEALKLKPNESGPAELPRHRLSAQRRSRSRAERRRRRRPDQARLSLGACHPRRDPRRQGRPRRRARRLRGGVEAVADARHGVGGARQGPGGARACGRRSRVRAASRLRAPPPKGAAPSLRSPRSASRRAAAATTRCSRRSPRSRAGAGFPPRRSRPSPMPG